MKSGPQTIEEKEKQKSCLVPQVTVEIVEVVQLVPHERIQKELWSSSVNRSTDHGGNRGIDHVASCHRSRRKSCGLSASQWHRSGKASWN